MTTYSHVPKWVLRGTDDLVFETLAEVLADKSRTAGLLAGNIIRVLAHGGFTLRVIATGVADHITAAGTLLQVDAPVLRPEYFGADPTGQVDSRTAFNKMIARLNDVNGPNEVALDGTYLAGNLDPITKPNTKIDGPGAKFIRNRPTALFNLTGPDIFLRIGEIDGGGLTGANIRVTGHRCRVTETYSHNTLGIGISIGDNAEDVEVLFCRTNNTGAGGIAVGKTVRPLVVGNNVANAGAEGIPCDLGNGAIIAFNEVFNAGGVGAFGCDGANNCVWIGNTARGQGGIRDGLRVVDHRTPGSRNLAIIGNNFSDNGGYGIRIKNDYRQCAIVAINLGPVTTVQMASISVSAIALNNPIRVTAVSHGKVTGDRVKFNSINGTTELNGNIYRVKVIDANTIDLYDDTTFTPIDGTSGFTPYVSGGKVNNAIKNGDRVYLSGMTGANELLATEFIAVPTTGAVNTTITLKTANEEDVNSTGFTPYVSGGIVHAGDRADGVTVIGNICEGNGLGEILVETHLPLSPATHTIIQGALIRLADLPEYASQADALNAGLVAGTLYRNASGVIVQKV